jgi:hypothetical protein
MNTIYLNNNNNNNNNNNFYVFKLQLIIHVYERVTVLFLRI